MPEAAGEEAPRRLVHGTGQGNARKLMVYFEAWVLPRMRICEDPTIQVVAAVPVTQGMHHRSYEQSFIVDSREVFFVTLKSTQEKLSHFKKEGYCLKVSF